MEKKRVEGPRGKRGKYKILPWARRAVRPAALSAVLAALLLASALTGCGGDQEDEPVELTFIHGWGGTVKTHATMMEIYEEFERENPDIVLRYQPSSDSSIAVEKANDMLAVDKMPDIVSTNGQSYYVQNAVKRGMALDLMPYIEGDESFGRLIHPAVLEKWTTPGGAIYTVPDALEVMGYWYRVSAFREAGLVDENGEVRTPATWEEFYEACDRLEALAEDGGGSLGLEHPYSLDTVQTVENLFLARLAGAGEEGLSMAQGVPETFDTEVFRRTVSDFARIYAYSGPVAGLDDARQYFKDGKTAMFFNGVWESEGLSECEDAGDMAYANYPTESGQSLSYISPSSGYILADSGGEREKEAAVRFLKYILSGEVQLKLALETGQAPSNPNVDAEKIISGYPMLGKALSKAHEADIQIKTVSSVWNSSLMKALGDALKSGCQTQEGIQKLIERMDRVAG